MLLLLLLCFYPVVMVSCWTTNAVSLQHCGGDSITGRHHSTGEHNVCTEFYLMYCSSSSSYIDQHSFSTFMCMCTYRGLLQLLLYAWESPHTLCILYMTVTTRFVSIPLNSKVFLKGASVSFQVASLPARMLYVLLLCSNTVYMAQCTCVHDTVLCTWYSVAQCTSVPTNL